MASASQMLPRILGTLLAVCLISKAGAEAIGAQARVFIAQAVPYMKLAIGTPPRNITTMIDTASTLVWTQCQPCVKCYQQPLPIFNPSSSSTFAPQQCMSPQCNNFMLYAPCMPEENCGYSYGYGNGNPDARTSGTLSTETFTIGGVTFPNIAFGCSNTTGSGFTAGCGIAGFAMDPLSLPSQLGLTKFAYCVPYISEGRLGTIFLGSEAILKGSKVLTIPFVRNPIRPSLYYLAWTGITVGNTRLPIPSEMLRIDPQSGQGGMFIDSGGVSVLAESVFRFVESAFLAQVKLRRSYSSPFPLCFAMPKGATPESLDLPRMVLHFKGADWELPLYNYMNVWEESVCLLFQKSQHGKSVLAMFQQYGSYILYNLEKQTLSVATDASC